MYVSTTSSLSNHWSKDTSVVSVLATVNNTIMNMGVHISLGINVFKFSGWVPRRGIPGSYGSSQIDNSPKKVYRWTISTWKDAQHH